MRAIFLLFFMSSVSYAHCPVELKFNDEAYCLQVEWQLGERKHRGQFTEVDVQSPVLIPSRQVFRKWVYSRGHIYIWKKGDQSHSPVMLPEFRVFPFMEMDHDHESDHDAGSEFFYDTEIEGYVYRRTAFQKMHGCWTLRWTTDNFNSLNTSSKLMNVVEYSNLSEDERRHQKSLCNLGEDHKGHHAH